LGLSFPQPEGYGYSSFLFGSPFDCTESWAGVEGPCCKGAACDLSIQGKPRSYLALMEKKKKRNQKTP